MLSLNRIDPVVRQALLALPKSEDMLLLDKGPLLSSKVHIDPEEFLKPPYSDGSGQSERLGDCLVTPACSDDSDSKESWMHSEAAQTEAALMDQLAKSMADMPDFDDDSEQMMVWAANQGFFDDLPGGAAVQTRRKARHANAGGDLYESFVDAAGVEELPGAGKKGRSNLQILEPDIVQRLEQEEHEWQLVRDARGLRRAFFETPNLKDPAYTPPAIMQFSEALADISLEFQYVNGTADTHKGSIIRTHPVVDMKRPKLWQRRAGSKPNDLTFNPRSMVTRVVCSFSPTRTSLKLPQQQVKPKSSLHKKLASNFKRIVSL